MCLVLTEAIGFFSKLSAPWLSQLIIIAPVVMPKSFNSILSHKASLTAFEAAIYSASEVEAATVFCSLLFQLTAPPLRMYTKPVVDLLLLMSLAKSESQ